MVSVLQSNQTFRKMDVVIRCRLQMARWFQREISIFGSYRNRLQSEQTVSVNAGFALFKFYQDGETSRIEYRPYEDFVLNEKLGKVNLQHRLRFEQRFFKNVVNNKIQAETNFNYPFP